MYGIDAIAIAFVIMYGTTIFVCTWGVFKGIAKWSRKSKKPKLRLIKGGKYYD